MTQKVPQILYPHAIQIQPLTRYQNDIVDGYKVTTHTHEFIVEASSLLNKSGRQALARENRNLDIASGLPGIAQKDQYRKAMTSGITGYRALSKHNPPGTMLKDHHWLLPPAAFNNLLETLEDVHSKGLAGLTLGNNNLILNTAGNQLTLIDIGAAYQQKKGRGTDKTFLKLARQDEEKARTIDEKLRQEYLRLR